MFPQTNVHLVRNQYEKFPYPPVPFLALPLKNQGSGLSYELGTQLARGKRFSHRNIRILVAGGGTVEPLVVAQTHPQAAEIVTVDLSKTSLKILKRRLAFARIARFPHKLPPMRLVCQDLTEGLDSEEPFDFILASNILHHVPNPSLLLQILVRNLKPGGLIRVVTYPKMSRLWMRETARWLRGQGLKPDTPNLVKQVRRRIQTLPLHHPIRSCFENHPEARTAAGIVDAWMHACENPLSPLEWKNVSQQAGLRLVGETQTDSSRSTFLDEIIPELKALDTWSKLQILDDLLEICANPILWFERDRHSTTSEKPTAIDPIDSSNSLYWEMKQGLLRIQNLLQGTGVCLETVFNRFKTEVGPRYSIDLDTPLLGLALTDYNLNDILKTEQLSSNLRPRVDSPL